MGSCQPREIHWRDLGERGEIPTHKCTRIEGSGSCNKDFHQGQSSQNDSRANRQYMRPSLPNKYGRDKEPSDDQHSKIDLVISPRQGNNMHGRVHTLGTNVSLCFPSFQPSGENIEENKSSLYRHDHNYASLGITDLVSSASSNVNTKPIPSTTNSKPVAKPRKGKPPPSAK